MKMKSKTQGTIKYCNCVEMVNMKENIWISDQK